MAKTVFFSWQADTPKKVGRNFLNDILEEVCKNITTTGTFGEVLLDSDTQGVAGQPPITETILKKIDAASVFVADLTFTGVRMDEKRPTPNPNVLIEYGWALKTLTHHRVIYIMNAEYGEPDRNNLPFDLGHMRLPITYKLSENASTEVKAEQKKELSKLLDVAVRASLAMEPPPKVEAPPVFPAALPKDGPARFRSKGEALGVESGLLSDNTPKEIYLSPGPAMWLRLIPEKSLQKDWNTYDMKDLLLRGSNTLTLVPLILGSGWNPLRAEDGIGVYNGRSGIPTTVPNSIEVGDIAFAFTTGEIWSVDTEWLFSDKTRIPFIEEYYVQRIQNYAAFLRLLGAESPYRWIAGITGIKKRKLIRPDLPGRSFINTPLICLSDTIEAEGVYDGKQDARNALMPFFKKIFEACGVPRPDY